MADISQNVNIEMLEKLPDGTYKRKYPKTRADDGTTFDKHLAERATLDKLGHVKAETTADGTLIIPEPDVPKSNYNADRLPNENDDESQGYSVGSMWYHKDSSGSTRAYVCLNPESGSVEWELYTSSDGTEILFYSNGTEYVPFSVGGWSYSDYEGAISTLRKDPNSLYMSVDQGYTLTEIGFSSDEQVAFTDLKTINFEVEQLTPPNNSAIRARVGVSNIRNGRTADTGVMVSQSLISPSEKDRHIVSVNVSSLSGYYYIHTAIKRDTEMRIYKIWGEE